MRGLVLTGWGQWSDFRVFAEPGPSVDETGVTNCLVLELLCAVDRWLVPCVRSCYCSVEIPSVGAESEEFRVTAMQKCCEAFAELLGGLWVISVGSCELFA